MTELTHEQKTFIVTCLANFMSPTEVADEVKQEFGFEISRQNVRYYNPEQSPALPGQWRALFTLEREKAIAQVRAVGISHKAVRLRELQDLYRRAKKMKNIKLAAELMEQAAKECGGLYTNTRKIGTNPREALSELLGVDPDELFQVEDGNAEDEKAEKND